MNPILAFLRRSQSRKRKQRQRKRRLETISSDPFRAACPMIILHLVQDENEDEEEEEEEEEAWPQEQRYTEIYRHC